jgi:hypothetical protein
MEEKIGLRTLQAVAHYFWFWSRAAASLLVTDSGAPHRSEVRRRRLGATARPDHVNGVAVEGFLGPSSASGSELIIRPGNRSAWIQIGATWWSSLRCFWNGKLVGTLFIFRGQSRCAASA